MSRSRQWAGEEDDLIKLLFYEGRTDAEISKVIGRGVSSISSRRLRLRLPASCRPQPGSAQVAETHWKPRRKFMYLVGGEYLNPAAVSPSRLTGGRFVVAES